MPRAPKACAKTGCPKKVRAKSYCDEHKPMGWKGNPRTSTPEHRAWRREVLDQAHWRCQIRRPGCLGKVTQADHIVAVTQGGAEFDPANGQGACEPCHRWKSAMEGVAARRDPRPPLPPGSPLLR